jgi:hypothetical protein
MTSQHQAATCIRCRQPLPVDVTFCASCGFDNGEVQRMGQRATFDEKIEDRLLWLRFKQMFGWLGWLFPNK